MVEPGFEIRQMALEGQDFSCSAVSSHLLYNCFTKFLIAQAIFDFRIF
jgi:hypothetical protein